jgi:hypothetical protein
MLDGALIDGALIGGALIGGPSKTKSRTNTFVLESKAAPIDHEMGFTHVLAATVETDRGILSNIHTHTSGWNAKLYVWMCSLEVRLCVCA